MRSLDGRQRRYSLYSLNQPRCVTFKLPPDYEKIAKLNLPALFIKMNDIKNPGVIDLLGKDGKKQRVNLALDKKGTMSFGKGWKDFVKANGIEKGFTLEWEGDTHVLSLCYPECSGGRGECLPKEPRSGKNIIKDDNKEQEREKNHLRSKHSTCPNQPRVTGKNIIKDDNKEQEREKNHLRSKKHSTCPNQPRVVTMTLTPEDISACKLELPEHFMRDNGINRLGKVILLGKDDSWTLGYLLSKDGYVGLGCEWKNFCKDNGVKTGSTYSLEFVSEKDTKVVLKFSSKVDSPNTLKCK